MKYKNMVDTEVDLEGRDVRTQRGQVNPSLPRRSDRLQCGLGHPPCASGRWPPHFSFLIWVGVAGG